MAVIEADRHVHVLAERHAALRADLCRWLADHPHEGRHTPSPARKIGFKQGNHDYLFYLDEPPFVARLLEGLGADHQLVQMFHSPGQLVHFLSHPASRACIDHDRWHPWLMLPIPHAQHVRDWCGRVHPANWPWGVCYGAVAEGPAVPVVARLVEGMPQLLNTRTEQLNTRLEPKAYVGRPAPAEVLAAADRPIRVMTVAFTGSSYQKYCARDIAEGLRQVGAEVHTVLLDLPHLINFRVLEEIEAFDPDVLLLNGRGRCNFPFLPGELSVLTWDQDYAHAPSPVYADRKGARDRLMVMVADWQQDAVASGVAAEEVSHLNLGTNLGLYHRRPPPRPVADAPRYDVLFVGNIHPWETYRRIIGFHNLNPGRQGLLLEARRRLRDWVLGRGEDEPFILPDMDAFLLETAGGTRPVADGRAWRELVYYFRYRVAHFILRELYVTALSSFRLGLFGKGWADIEAVAAQARPSIVNGPELRDAVHCSALNLYLHTWTVHHPRLYDTAAAGGTLLVGRVPEQYPLEKVFEPGREVDTFGSIADLKQRIRHHLAHPEERREMGERAAERAARDHGMHRRMQQMLGTLKNNHG